MDSWVFLVDFDGNCVFLTLKHYSTLSYQKLSLIIDYTLLSEAKEIWIYRLDLIRIITLFFEVNWYEKIKITFFENLQFKKNPTYH